jgi:hypothetical protein
MTIAEVCFWMSAALNPIFRLLVFLNNFPKLVTLFSLFLLSLYLLLLLLVTWVLNLTLNRPCLITSRPSSNIVFSCHRS